MKKPFVFTIVFRVAEIKNISACTILLLLYLALLLYFFCKNQTVVVSGAPPRYKSHDWIPQFASIILRLTLLTRLPILWYMVLDATGCFSEF